MAIAKLYDSVQFYQHILIFVAEGAFVCACCDRACKNVAISCWLSVGGAEQLQLPWSGVILQKPSSLDKRRSKLCIL
ncbi:MAG: hypothetical protein ABFQ95_03460 [Pseudomonadota bacterium]